ncbi:hypothetical protein [Nocardia sp. NPDC051981]|uniref:hypothetical protein n=1 Tax=Nocardia sp. NPDC051981 TaxID=3155417 RepID=UPI00342BC074
MAPEGWCRAQTSREVIGRFLRATQTGDLRTLMDVLAPDVVQISDGGGKVSAARRPVIGAERVAHYLIGLSRKAMADMTVEVGTYNALPALLLRTADGRLGTVELIKTSGDRITGLYVIRNPDKLGTVELTRALER